MGEKFRNKPQALLCSDQTTHSDKGYSAESATTLILLKPQQVILF